MRRSEIYHKCLPAAWLGFKKPEHCPYCFSFSKDCSLITQMRFSFSNHINGEREILFLHSHQWSKRNSLSPGGKERFSLLMRIAFFHLTMVRQYSFLLEISACHPDFSLHDFPTGASGSALPAPRRGSPRSRPRCCPCLRSWEALPKGEGAVTGGAVTPKGSSSHPVGEGLAPCPTQREETRRAVRQGGTSPEGSFGQGRGAPAINHQARVAGLLLPQS